MTTYDPNTPTRRRVANELILSRQHEDEVREAITRSVAARERRNRVSAAIARRDLKEPK